MKKILSVIAGGALALGIASTASAEVTPTVTFENVSLSQKGQVVTATVTATSTPPQTVSRLGVCVWEDNRLGREAKFEKTNAVYLDASATTHTASKTLARGQYRYAGCFQKRDGSLVVGPEQRFVVYQAGFNR